MFIKLLHLHSQQSNLSVPSLHVCSNRPDPHRNSHLCNMNQHEHEPRQSRFLSILTTEPEYPILLCCLPAQTYTAQSGWVESWAVPFFRRIPPSFGCGCTRTAAQAAGWCCPASSQPHHPACATSAPLPSVPWHGHTENVPALSGRLQHSWGEQLQGPSLAAPKSEQPTVPSSRPGLLPELGVLGPQSDPQTGLHVEALTRAVFSWQVP